MNQQHSFAWDDPQPAYPARVKVSRDELEANRAKLAEKIAKATGAIISPEGALVLEDVAALPQKPKEISEPMNEPVAVHTSTNGASAKTAAADSRNTRKPPTDDHLRTMHAEYMAGSTIRDIATKHHTSNATLSKHFARLGLEVRPVGFRRNGGKGSGEATASPDTRQPYVSPVVTAVALNGDGPHAEAAREMVAASVGAQTSAETAVALTTPEPVQTAVPLPGNILAFLADMQAIGGRVEISGEMNVNIKVTF